jgi:23S rRNA (cytosine1962-C5)-methyltransferase
MKYDRHLTTNQWDDYELIDSGENMKLERYGAAIVARPETQALWAKRLPERWEEANAVFSFGGETKGSWDVRKAVPEPWQIARGPIRFSLELTNFKHTGIFPEQEPNWIWIKDRVESLKEKTGQPKVLNLFGYTGGATLAAAHPGAFVTHVDASKQSLDWAHENGRLTGLSEDSVRWILDDALAFAKREVRRGAKYEGVILDPPAFGRGAKGEVWKIEENLPELLAALKELLSDTPGSFFLANGYAAGYAPRSFAQAVESAFGETEGESGELFIKESSSERVIPAGIYVRFVR